MGHIWSVDMADQFWMNCMIPNPSAPVALENKDALGYTFSSVVVASRNPPNLLYSSSTQAVQIPSISLPYEESQHGLYLGFKESTT